MATRKRDSMRQKQARQQRLRALMEEYGLSAKDVAQILEISKNRVFGWLSHGLTAPITGLGLRLLECELRVRELEATLRQRR